MTIECLHNRSCSASNLSGTVAASNAVTSPGAADGLQGSQVIYTMRHELGLGCDDVYIY